MVHDLRSPLSCYIADLLSGGQTVFTAGDAKKALNVNHGAFLDAAERLQRRKALLNPRQGFYVIVPQQFAAWGAPPPAWYIDALMRYEGESRGYYVSILKAAESHGASHQAVMEFQVISGKRLPKIRAGRSMIAFYFRKDIDTVIAGIEDCKTNTGMMNISSAALTALDLLRYPQASGGIDNVATVLFELGSKINAKQLAALSSSFERPVIQRLGHLLDRVGHSSSAIPMYKKLFYRGHPPWTELDRSEVRDPYFTYEPLEHDSRWRVIVRRIPERDW